MYKIIKRKRNWIVFETFLKRFKSNYEKNLILNKNLRETFLKCFRLNYEKKNNFEKSNYETFQKRFWNVSKRRTLETFLKRFRNVLETFILNLKRFRNVSRYKMKRFWNVSETFCATRDETIIKFYLLRPEKSLIENLEFNSS